MASRPGLALLGALAVLAVTVTSAAGGAPPATLALPGAVTAIAADGQRVAAAVRIAGGCDRAVVWSAPGATTQAFVSKNACAGTVFNGIPEIALAGNRLEWLATAGGNFQDQVLEAATLGRPGVVKLAFAENEAGAAGGVDGNWIGHLHGGGTLLVYNTWRECSLSRRQGAPPCQGTLAGGIRYSQQALWKLVGLTKARIRSGDDALAAVAVDAGRVALQSVADGSIVVVDRTGSPLTSSAITAGTNAGTAMQGSQVVTLRGTTMQVWDSATGHLNGSVALPAGTGAPVLRDVQSGLAVYVRGRAVHVVRLADSKEAVYVVPGTRAVDAQIEAAGLFYAYNARSGAARGRVVFVPWAALQQKIH